MTPGILTVEALGKRYGARDVLAGVSFGVRSGEAVGYLGPNGAGKTTTLKILAGISRPTRGNVRLFGFDPVTDRNQALRRVGSLVETPGIPPYLTGGDLLGYVARVKGVPLPDRRAAVRRAAESMGVADQLDRPFGTLSTGLARRTLLASTLVQEPEVLLLDEPTLGLDPAARHDLRVVLRGLARRGVAILLSTHLLEDVEEVCERVLFLRGGALVGDEPVHGANEPRGSNRSVRIRFGDAAAEGSVRSLLGPEVEVEWHGGQEATVRFSGGDVQQAELLARLIRAGLPVVSAAPPESDLARRYFERVGREDGP